MIGKICVENPVCIMSSVYRKPDQIIHPYYFGDNGFALIVIFCIHTGTLEVPVWI